MDDGTQDCPKPESGEGGADEDCVDDGKGCDTDEYKVPLDRIVEICS